VDQRTSLVNQLHIDRSEPTSVGKPWLWWLSVPTLLVGAMAAAWLLYGTSNATAVGVATAEQVSGPATTTRGSILDASGYVIPRRQATVSSKITGKVVEVLIEEGQSVEEGQIIARLDDTNYRAAVAQAEAQLELAEANLQAALVAFTNAQPTFDRSQEQFQHAVISAQALDTARAAYDVARTGVQVAQRAVQVSQATLAITQRNLDDTIVRAPFAGVVTVKAAQEGEMVSPVSAGGGFTRTGIGTIVDMDSLEIEVDVSDSFINRVRSDQDVTARLNAYPDWEIPARVIAIIPTADRAKATVRVRVGLANKDARVLPQMGVRVAFLTDELVDVAAQSARPAVIVPQEAVQVSGNSSNTGVVFIVRDGTVERRAVRLGARTSAGQVILAGLEPGTSLAVGDLSQLADGAKVRVEN
jgi:RND family efflux transporter MFP subunit